MVKTMNLIKKFFNEEKKRGVTELFAGGSLFMLPAVYDTFREGGVELMLVSNDFHLLVAALVAMAVRKFVKKRA